MAKECSKVFIIADMLCRGITANLNHNTPIDCVGTEHGAVAAVFVNRFTEPSYNSLRCR